MQYREPEEVDILVGCEYSGAVREAFLALGFNAFSCDLLPDENGSNRHFQEDLRDVMRESNWDFMCVMHPPCTTLCNSSVRWLHQDCVKGTPEQRWHEMRQGAMFFSECYNSDVPSVVVENPIMHKHAKAEIAKYIDGYTGPTQYVHPYYFGEPAMKTTGLLNRNMIQLKATNKLEKPKPGTEEHKLWSAIHRAPPGPDRWKFRSRTFPSIAKAMAEQYGHYLLHTH